MTRPIDKVKVEIIGGSANGTVLDNFTSFDLTNDMAAPSEAAFELGDDGTFSDIEPAVLPGVQYRVFVNDRLQLTGRVERTEVPLDTGMGSVVQYSIRSKLADAMFASAHPKTRIKKTTVKDFVLAVFDPLGYAESDFVFDPSAARDLLTGESTSGQGEPKKVELDSLKAEQAKVNPPETIYAAADRHLRRHGLMLWDSPDGKIVIGYPNDTADPIYFLRMYKGADGRFNNVMRATRHLDWSGIPSTLGVFGIGGGREFTQSKVSAVVGDDDVLNAGFYRPTLIIAEGIKTEGLAEHAARRELSARSKNKDAWDVEVDGFSHWTGDRAINWAVDNTVQVVTDVAGGPVGAYYVHKVAMRRNAASGDTASVTMVKRGIWRL